MFSYFYPLTRKTAFLAGLFCTSIALAANPLPPDQATELGKLFQTYSVDNQAAVAAHKQAELQQTKIVTQQARVDELQGKSDRAESELGELQEFDRKKPGKVKPEEMETARSKHLQAQADVEAAQHQLEQQQSNFIQLKEDLSKKILATENSITAYRIRFAALATEAVARRVSGYKIAQQITESANVSCEDLPISACKTKTQQEVQRRAIEKGAIIVVDSITEIKNLTLQKDEVRSEVHGEISNLKILETRLTDEPATFFMKIQATVTPVIGDSLLEEIQRTVLSDMSLQMGDGGLAFKSPESMILSPMETGAIPIMPSTYKKKEFAPLLKKAQAGDAQAQYEIAVLYEYGLGSVKVDRAKAMAWYEKAAAQNHIRAQTGLAYIYIFDSGAKEDLSKANTLLDKSAEKGDAFAKLLLVKFKNLISASKLDPETAHIITEAELKALRKDEAESKKKAITSDLPALEKFAQRGDPVVQWFVAGFYFELKDDAKAFMWLERSARQGNVYAQHELGQKYLNGSGVAKNEIKAFEWVQRAALQGYSSAQYDLGNMYQKGTGIAKNEAKAVELIKMAALQGWQWAQRDMGERYARGEGVKKNEAKAFEWYEKAALQDNASAQLYLGALYEKAGNYKKAFEWYEKCSENSPALGLFNLGLLYLNGKGVTKNEAQAFKLIEQYAGNSDGLMLAALLEGEFDSGKMEKAQYQLGLMYLRGIGVAKNEAKAFELMSQAAYSLSHEPNKEALFYLGWMYLNGVGVEKSEARAFYYYEKAALLGEVNAQTRLGIMYLEGSGITKNEVTATKWFEKAAIQGWGEAQYLLGLSYQEGVGIRKDIVLSYAWLNLAAARGHEEAKKFRDEITLTAIQRAEAERLSSNWKPGKPMRRAKQ